MSIGEKTDESADLERLCQGVSPGYAACTYPGEITDPHSNTRAGWQEEFLRSLRSRAKYFTNTKKYTLGYELSVRFPCVASHNSTLAAPVRPTTIMSSRGSLNC